VIQPAAGAVAAGAEVEEGRGNSMVPSSSKATKMTSSPGFRPGRSPAMVPVAPLRT
jgi:hypothetical protein